MTGAAATDATTALIGLARDPVALFDAEGMLVASNPAMSDALRQVAGFLAPGTGWDLFLDGCRRKGLLSQSGAATLRMIEEGLLDRPEAQPPVLFRLTDSIAAQARLTALPDDGFALCLTDMEHHSVEEPELEEIMTKVLQACPTCLTMSRIGDGRILYRSPAAVELLGKGLDSHLHFARSLERADFLAALLPAARVDDMSITARGTNGRNFPALISARLIDYRGEDVIVSTIIDLSDRKAAEAEIERQKRQLFQFEKMSALGEVLAGVAHELNNPLSVVVGSTHLLLEEDLDPAVRPRVEKMVGAAERCVRIVRTFLSLARDRPMDLTVARPEDLVGSAVDAFLAADKGRELEIRVALDDDLPDLLVDEVQLVQVLTNLVVNAAQAIRSSGVGGTIRIDGRLRGRSVCLRVADDGPGVPDDLRERIFEPLFTTKAAGEGTGLGLALSHRILAAHGGSIELEPPVAGNGGATFRLELPLAPR